MSQSDYGKISLRSPNFQSELARQLADLAPQIISDGKLDVEKLQELLGEDSIGGGMKNLV
jgi:site-specific DNA-methyltransferase (adenine-specific)